ncbi:MAG: hypothetical protein RBT25_11645 [Lentisphaeria bacterium]|nr:hypothetical protein [Lentisphaeria bacterium]
MSMMAVILVCAAPAVVSLIDDSMQSEQMISLGSYVEADNSSPFITKSVDTPEDADMTLSYISGSTNGGTHVFTLNTPANKTYVSIIQGLRIDNSVFDAGVSRIVLNFSGSDVDSVRLNTLIPGGAYTYVQFSEILDADGVGTNSFVCDLDSYSLAKIKSNDVSPMLQIYFDDGFSGVIEMTSETYAFTTIPYGEMIIGATGALLLICAILATPWMSTAGLTVKKRR